MVVEADALVPFLREDQLGWLTIDLGNGTFPQSISWVVKLKPKFIDQLRTKWDIQKPTTPGGSLTLGSSRL